MNLTDFLLARIAEDEAVAQAATPGPWSCSTINDPHVWAGDDPGDGIAHASWETGDRSSADFAHIARHDPARVLAECAAKRRIVEIHAYDPCGVCSDGRFDAPQPCDTMRALMLPYADHPDYRQEWKP